MCMEYGHQRPNFGGHFGPQNQSKCRSLVILSDSFHWIHISFSSHAHCKYFLMCVESMTQRQNFSELLCTCFEICNWNLAYSSGRWYNTSSWSFIAMRLIWPTLQPGNFWPCGLKRSEGGNHWSDRLGSLPLESFPKEMSKGFEVSTWKLVDILSRLHNILSSRFTRMGFLWPTSCYWPRHG